MKTLKNFFRSVTATLIIVAISAFLFGFTVPEGYQKINDECYLQMDPYDTGSNNYVRLHFRGAKYGTREYMSAIFVAISAIEGIVQSVPNYYSLTITIANLYQWDEIIEKIKVALATVEVERKSKAEDPQVSKQKLGL